MKLEKRPGPEILVVDMSSQYTLVIGRTLREIEYRSIISSPAKATKQLKKWRPKAIILSGGASSVYDENAPQPPEGILEMGIPILGICYGMQWIANKCGGLISRKVEEKEYGPVEVNLSMNDELFSELPESVGNMRTVWASHGDSVGVIPAGFKQIGTSSNRTVAAISCRKKKIWGVQFHPEVTETVSGKDILKKFLGGICGCKPNWNAEDTIQKKRDAALKIIGNEKAILGFSGGVDSSSAAALLSSALDNRLLGICIDTGFLRENELEEIGDNARSAGIILKVVHAAGRFQKAIGNTIDAETKRRRFSKTYEAILKEEAKKFGATFIIQGTLATDLIESKRAGKATKIKSHHNTGLKFLGLTEVCPFKDLFKYEVRELARKLGLPKSISERQPSPGPGLLLRVNGKPATPKRVKIVRWADARAKSILIEHGIYDDISQFTLALNCVKTVGIKGDGRVYGYSIVVRGITTVDFMTAYGYQIPAEIRRKITNTITKHPKIIRVYYDETNKPPATTEPE